METQASSGESRVLDRIDDGLLGMEVLGCRLLDQIGSGGSGTVFRARQLRLDRDVAVKLVPAADADVSTAERFRREVRAVASLDHPHVVPVHDAGEDQGLLVLVMKLVDGVDLRSLVAERGPVEPSAAVAVIEQVAGALDAAHGSGLVHRDVKPANILLSRGADRIAYLADFGLARTQALTDTVTAESHWVGTPAYAAPEQRAGGEVGPAADCYGLAGVLAFLVTGVHPGGDVDLERLTPQARAVLGVAESGMATSPHGRFASGAALVEAARAAAGLEGETVQLPVEGRTPSGASARPGSPASPGRPAEQPTREARPSRAPTYAMVLALFLLGFGIAAAAWAVLTGQFADGASPPTAGPAATSSPSTSASPSSSPSASAAPSTYPRLDTGSDGPAVQAAQLLFQARGQELAATGTWDTATADAVERLSLARTGMPQRVLDDTTWSQLVVSQQRGQTGPAARAVQVLLQAAGVPVVVDGAFGEQTESAVRRFQRERLLLPDGVVGPVTWPVLLRAAAAGASPGTASDPASGGAASGSADDAGSD